MNQFPNAAKFTLRASMEDCVLAMLKLLIKQNYKAASDEKREMLLDFIAESQILGVLLYQAMVFKYLSYDSHKKTSGLLKEITAMAAAQRRNIGGEI